MLNAVDARCHVGSVRQVRRCPIPAGDGRKERLGIGVLRRPKDRRRWSLLDDDTIFHNRNSVANLRCDPQVVGDEDHRQPEPRAEIRKKLQHLRLHGDIERGDRFVRNEHFRIEGKGARQADALALPAGEFMGIAVGRFRVEADEREQVFGAGKRSSGGSRHGPSGPARRAHRRGVAD